MPANEETQQLLRECRRSLPADIDREKAVFGFDGVVDRVRSVVDTRAGPDEYETMETMGEFSDRIDRSAGLNTSLSIEWRNRGKRAGGHTSHLGRAMERLGCKPTVIGTFGDPPVETFTKEYDRAEIISLGEAPTTDAVEFNDGKVLLSDSGVLASLDWDQICETVGLNTLASRVDRTRVLGIGYWATVLQMPSILEGLREDLWPRLRDPPGRVLFDPADIRRLSERTLEDGVDALDELDDTVPVTVSSNRAETLRIAGLFGNDQDASLLDTARVAREGLGVSKFVTHTVSEAVSVTAEEDYRIEIPREEEPELTTSAGDHFNAGLALGHMADLGDGQQLIAGSAVAGYFVRNGEPPTYDDLLAFLDRYEDLFTESPSAD